MNCTRTVLFCLSVALAKVISFVLVVREFLVSLLKVSFVRVASRGEVGLFAQSAARKFCNFALQGLAISVFGMQVACTQALQLHRFAVAREWRALANIWVKVKSGVLVLDSQALRTAKQGAKFCIGFLAKVLGIQVARDRGMVVAHFEANTPIDRTRIGTAAQVRVINHGARLYRRVPVI